MLGNHSQAKAAVVRNQGGVMCRRHNAGQLRPAREKAAHRGGQWVCCRALCALGPASPHEGNRGSGSLCPPLPATSGPRYHGIQAGFVPLALSCCLGSVLLHHQKAPDGCWGFIMENKVWGKMQSCVEGRINLLCPGTKRCGREKHELPAAVTAVLGSLPACLPVCPPVQLSVRLSARPPAQLSACLSVKRAVSVTGLC